MGNSNTTNYENDPYLNPNNRDRNLLNSIYNNNSSVVPIYSADQNNQANLKLLAEQQVTKKTKAYKNPIRLDRNTIKLEKDGMKPGIYYITFTYSSEKPLIANFYFNAELNPEQNSNNINFVPSEKFQNCVIKGNLEMGNNIKFLNNNVFFDMTFYLQNRIFDNRHSDLIIELIALTPQETVECIFATFCKIIPEKDGSYKIKPELQKLKVSNTWFDIQDIYGFTADNNECEICCNSRKNTIFLPCKHSYACKNCAIMIRIKGNNCPICRQAISDSVVIENIDTIENKTTQEDGNK